MIGWQVDKREPETLMEYFKGLGARAAILEVGDYVFQDIVGFERKADDFVDFDRTLSQAEELKRTYPAAFLVVEGNLDDIIRKANQIYGVVMTMRIIGLVASLAVRGIVPIFCSNQGILMLVMEKIAEKSIDDKERISLPKQLRNREFGDNTTAISVLLGFPGIGVKRAKLIADRYGGDIKKILGIIVNNTDELGIIDGIGKGTVETLKGILNQNRNGLVI